MGCNTTPYANIDICSELLSSKPSLIYFTLKLIRKWMELLL